MIDLQAFEQALEFLRQIPPESRPDDMNSEPDGDVCLNWDPGSDELSISVSNAGRLSYAGRMNGKKPHGIFPLTNIVPPMIAELIDEITKGRRR